MSEPQALNFKCPYKSTMVLSPANSDEDSQKTVAGRGFSPGPCPPVKTSTDHRNEVLAATGRLYTKRAKYNKEFENIIQTKNENTSEKMAIDEEQERIDRAVQALEERKKALEKAIGDLKDREEAAKAYLDKIEAGICMMNQEIKNAFLD